MACKVQVERGVHCDAVRLSIIQLTSMLFSPVVTFLSTQKRFAVCTGSGSEKRSRPAKMSDRVNSSSAL